MKEEVNKTVDNLEKISACVIVKNEENPVQISKQINNCLENKNEVMKLYKKWKKENDALSKQSVKDFLDM